MTIASNALRLYLTDTHPCAYLPDQPARTLFVDPTARMDDDRAQWLQQRGFRRSGMDFYRPACEYCQQCVAVRLPVAAFQPNRSQRRVAQRNADVQCNCRPAQFDPEHHRLYARYLLARHGDGDMAEDVSAAAYQRFLLAAWGGTTVLLELRHAGELLAVAVTDVLPDGLSAVYTFFDPEHAARSLGTAAILMQIREVQRRAGRYLYLGYWIADSHKMAYKQQFRPLEWWDGVGWRALAAKQALPVL